MATIAGAAQSTRVLPAGVALRARPASRPGHEPSFRDASNDDQLVALVTGEIIPRLMLAHRPVAPAMAVALDAAAFAPLTLEESATALLAHVDRLVDVGVPVETLMVDLLAPAARQLGEWWEEDRCDFVEVTMGLWRLQEVVRELSARVPPASRHGGHSALFAAFPGDQHDFGALMVGEMFHRHGWEAETLVGADMKELLAEVGRRSYDLVGLTLSCDCHSARLPSAILALRSVSRNPRLRVLVGGRVLNEDPALARRAGADGTAGDARAAVALADALMDAAVGEFAARG